VNPDPAPPAPAEELLRQSEEGMRLLVESVKDYAIFMLDPTGRITSWNRGAERIKGYRADEILGAHFSLFYPLDAIAARHPEHELDVANREGRYEEEGWRLRKDGERFWASVVITAIHDPVTGTLRGFAKVTRDLSEQRRMQAQALRERLRAEETQRALAQRDEFIGLVAHELRTPLSVLELKIQSVTRALLETTGDAHERGATPTKLTGRLDDALRQLERLTELVERLLDASSIVQGQLALEPEPTHLAEIVTRVVARHREPALRMGTELRLRVATDGAGTWDRVRLEQAVGNLVSNAIKYGRGQPVELAVEAARTGVRLRVADHGIGIAPEDLARIFTRFERAAPVGHYGGLGLGLYVTRSIVEAHGGTIDVSSHPGEGTTFVIELPTNPHAHRDPPHEDV
jgi:PAS domain S-box-containing protein